MVLSMKFKQALFIEEILEILYVLLQKSLGGEPLPQIS